MYLKSLEINGFKSFGKKGILEFTSPISAIVGPNGSGKSNVAEAFRFALGEQSLKSMRGKKGEDLIYNGSESVSRLNRASVKVVFDNSRRVLPLDFEEVMIERVVHRDGINEYFLNGSVVRLKDIQELLSHAHIGASGHHIISQGEADRILSANQKERRSMLEDALGLKVYQYKKLESERKLKSTEENMKQVESLRRELAPHLKFLKKQVEKIERAESLRGELAIAYKEYLKREEYYLQQAKIEIEKNFVPAQAEYDELTRKLEIVKRTLESGNEDNQAKLELIETEKGLRMMREELQKFSHEMGRIEGEIGSLERMIERAERAQSEKKNITIELETLEKLEREIEAETLVEKIKEMIRNFISSYRSRTDEAETKLYHDDRERLTREKGEIAKRIEEKEKETVVAQEKIKELSERIAQVASGSREAEREMFQIMSRQNELSGTLAMLRGQKNSLEIEAQDFKRELGEAAILIGRTVTEYEAMVIENIEEERSRQIERRRTLEKMKIRLEELGGGGADEIMKEYRETEERDAFLAREVADLEKSGADLRLLIKDLEIRLDTEFKSGIQKINKEFQNYFELLFGGGKASLVVVRAEKKRSDTEIDMGEAEADFASEATTAEEGIEIAVDLPKKKVKALMMLSGGERALTSIALLFAMTSVNPPPFIILDETDAALDEANSRKYGDMIENLSKFSQLIVITHNRETMSRAGVLYGVTQISGLSKLLSIKFDEAVAVAK